MLVFRTVKEYLRGSMWALPTVFVLSGVVGGALLARVQVPSDAESASLVFGGGAEAARSVLQVISGSVITVTSLTFSLTVVALQMASSQFSPRLMRKFLRDQANQLVLSLFLGTFAFCVVVLRAVRTGGSQTEELVPSVAVTVAVVLAIASVGAFVFFIHHLTQSVRVETILRQIESETCGVIERMTHDVPAQHEVSVAGTGVEAAIRSSESGYVQNLVPENIVERAAREDAVVTFTHSAGDHVTEGTVLALVRRTGGRGPADVSEELATQVRNVVKIGSERTMQQEARFGIRQIVDVALRALSPSLNDPTTAIMATGHLTVILCRLVTRPLGPRAERDDAGTIRVEVPFPLFEDYLELACGQILQYGSHDATVVRALLALLDDVGQVAPDDDRRAALLSMLDRIEEAAGRRIESETDRSELLRAAGDLRQVISDPSRAVARRAGPPSDRAS